MAIQEVHPHQELDPRTRWKRLCTFHCSVLSAGTSSAQLTRSPLTKSEFAKRAQLVCYLSADARSDTMGSAGTLSEISHTLRVSH